MQKDKYLGKTVNGYKILSIVGRYSDGHKKYSAECLKCGFIWPSASIATIKQSQDTECMHAIHIFSNYQLENIFKGMKERCYNKENKSYRFYGEKGISICKEWLENPISFEKWALNNGYEPGLSIDRIDENKGYQPDNCRWITVQDNSKWKSTTNMIFANGIVDSGRGWAKRLGVGVNYVNKYLRKNGHDATVKMIQSKLTK